MDTEADPCRLRYPRHVWLKEKERALMLLVRFLGCWVFLFRLRLLGLAVSGSIKELNSSYDRP